MKSEEIKKLRRTVWNYYKKHKRSMPWRESEDSYCILVSEIMLQQTQVSRVLKKYPQFVSVFPNFFSLAKAPLSKILKLWEGMGYNRRAIALKKISEKIINEYSGILPNDPEVLLTFPGIGKATAGSIVAFAYNLPTVFIETNIRRVFIYHFFGDRKNIRDDELMPFLRSVLSKKNPREWYWALMDYGTHLAEVLKRDNPNKRSAAYHRQSKFEGSNRKVRGAIIRVLNDGKEKTKKEISFLIKEDSVRLEKLLSDLIREGFLHYTKNKYKLRS